MHANTMPSLEIQTVTLSRTCLVRLSPNIRGQARPSHSAPTVSCDNNDMAHWLWVVYNLSATLSEAKQLCKANALSLRWLCCDTSTALYVIFN